MARTPQVMTQSRAAQFLGVSRETLRVWTRKGVGPPRTRMGKRYWYSLEAVREWLSNNCKPIEPTPPRVKPQPRPMPAVVGKRVNGVLYVREERKNAA
jgi:excisionase family DNA binding protein